MTHKANQRKPNTNEAMRTLLERIKSEIIECVDYKTMCVDDCYGCPKKILEFLIATVEIWESRLSENEMILLGDLNKISKIAEKSRKALLKNNLI